MQQLRGKSRDLAFYKCGKCQTHKRLNKELWGYVRPPRCTNCGALDWRIDLYRTNERKRRTGRYQRCYCGGTHFVHRPGSTRYCVHSKDYEEACDSGYAYQ